MKLTKFMDHAWVLYSNREYPDRGVFQITVGRDRGRWIAYGRLWPLAWRVTPRVSIGYAGPWAFYAEEKGD